jgi:hypothetical protein
MTKVPVRGSAVAFADTVNCSVPGPTPDAEPFREIQFGRALADHAQPDGAAIVTVSDAPAARYTSVGLIAVIQGGRIPVPDSSTDCGDVPADSRNNRLAVRLPNAVGTKLIFTVHAAAAARVLPQLELAM